jgi:pimeloyl-ACP methyl ester carboxylesterase
VLLLTLALLSGSVDSVVARDIQVAPGETLRITTIGAGPSVVLIPGLFGGAFGYRGVVRPLVAQGYRCIVIEPLGYGWSSHPRQADYSFAAQTLRVGAALDSLGVGRALFVAQSTGASIALRLAVARPELVRGLLAIDGGPVESAATPGMKRAFKLGGFAAKLVLDQSKLRHDVRREIIRNSGDTSWVTDAVIREYTAPQAADLDGSIDAFHQMSKAKEADSLVNRLSLYHGPVWLLVGSVRHPAEVSDAQQALLRERLPNFRSESVAGSGQYISEERPAVVVAAVNGLDQASK